VELARYASYTNFSSILLERLSPYGDYPVGLLRGRSTREQKFNIRHILRKCCEFEIQTHRLEQISKEHMTVETNVIYTLQWRNFRSHRN
jgi:hypothetical protein